MIYTVNKYSIKEKIMSWNEADHPRDELGRFTYDGGGEQEEAGDSKNNYRVDF